MEIKFYYNQSDNRTVNKTITEAVTLTGNLREESSVIKPHLRISHEGYANYNYVYIPDFKRYYYISNVTSVRNGVWDLDLEVDVLMSFRGDINGYQIVVDKQESCSIGDEYIDDGSLVTDNKMFSRVYQFSNGFNDSGEFILITTG